MQQLTGTVSKISPQTAKVEVTRRWTHPIYHKTVTRRKRYLVQADIAVVPGDRVILTPCRPVSKMKRWKISKKL